MSLSPGLIQELQNTPADRSIMVHTNDGRSNSTFLVRIDTSQNTLFVNNHTSAGDYGIPLDSIINVNISGTDY